MANIYFYLLTLAITLEAAPRRQFENIQISNEANDDVLDIMKMLKDIAMENTGEDGLLTDENPENTNALAPLSSPGHGDTRLAGANDAKKEPRIVFFMVMVDPSHLNDTMCEYDRDNEFYTMNDTIYDSDNDLHLYNHELSCRCRFCKKNLFDQDFKQRCAKDDCVPFDGEYYINKKVGADGEPDAEDSTDGDQKKENTDEQETEYKNSTVSQEDIDKLDDKKLEGEQQNDTVSQEDADVVNEKEKADEYMRKALKYVKHTFGDKTRCLEQRCDLKNSDEHKLFCRGRNCEFKYI